MEILDPQNTVLTNAEVYNIVVEKKKAFSSAPKDHRASPALRTVIYEVCAFKYF